MMQPGEVEQVLHNWIAEANSPVGQFATDVDRARWVATHFTAWWVKQIGEDYHRVASLVGGLDRVLKEDLGVTRSTEAGDEALDYLEMLDAALQDLAASMVLTPDTPK